MPARVLAHVDAPLPQNLALQVQRDQRPHVHAAAQRARPQAAPRLLVHVARLRPVLRRHAQERHAAGRGDAALSNEDENEIYFDAAFDDGRLAHRHGRPDDDRAGRGRLGALVFTPPAGQLRDARPSSSTGSGCSPSLIAGEGASCASSSPTPRSSSSTLARCLSRSRSRARSRVVNRSRRPSTSRCRRREKLREKSVAVVAAAASRRTLRPREARPIEVRFAPQARIPPFSEPIVAEVMRHPRAMIQVSAACVAMDLRLEMDALSFGQTTLHPRITRPLMLQNKGDIPSTWKPRQGAFAPDFSISPLEGYLQPNEDTNIEVTFHPRASTATSATSASRSTSTASRRSRSRSRACASRRRPRRRRSPSRRPCAWRPRVDRDQEPVHRPWTIKPVVQDEEWSGAEVLEVPAGGTGEYEVTYCPMMMTARTEGERSTRARSSSRSPTARPSSTRSRARPRAARRRPTTSRRRTRQDSAHRRARRRQLAQAAAALPRRHPAGRGHRATHRAQGPRARRRARRPVAHLRPLLLRLQGGHDQRRGALHQRQERRVPLLQPPHGRPRACCDTIEMQAPLRQLTSHLAAAAQPARRAGHILGVRSTTPRSPSRTRSRCPPRARPSSPSSGARCCRRRRPAQLTLASAELGTFNYDLGWQALPAGETKSMQFKVRARLARRRCASASSTSCASPRRTSSRSRPRRRRAPIDFECDATINAPAAEGSNGAETAVDVTFEPSSMQSSEALLTITSAEGGEYTCDLKGEALPPRPQGPIAIKANASAQVNFKNVFQSQAEFSFVRGTSPAFTVAKPKEAVRLAQEADDDRRRFQAASGDEGGREALGQADRVDAGRLHAAVLPLGRELDHRPSAGAARRGPAGEPPRSR